MVNFGRLISKEKDLTVSLSDVVCTATSGSMHQKTSFAPSTNPVPRGSMKKPIGRAYVSVIAGETTWEMDMCARSRKSMQITAKFVSLLYSVSQWENTYSIDIVARTG
jgi:hypothetical protein